MDDEKRFWNRVNKNGPKQPHMKTRCWAWTGPPEKDGYGRPWFRNTKWRSNRAAWVIRFGEIPDGMRVLHECDVRLCVRHLFLGTTADNQRDMVRKGRSLWGERNAKAKLVDSEVGEVFRLRSEGWTQRAIGDKFGVTQAQVSNILLRKQRVRRGGPGT